MDDGQEPETENLESDISITEETQELEPRIERTKAKQWEYTDARKASLAKARQKAKELREQLKIVTKPKEKKPSKMEQQLAQLKQVDTAIPLTTTKFIEPETPVSDEPKPSDIWLGRDFTDRSSVGMKLKPMIVRQGKLVYLT